MAERSPPPTPDGYELEGPLGRGGSAEVYRAREISLDRLIALKVEREGMSSTGKAHLEAEARRTAQLDHPAVAPVHTLGRVADGRLFFTMKELRGRPLSSIVAEAEDWPSHRFLRRCVDTLIRVADALAFAHSRDVVHRDVKPDNIVVGDYGETYLIDWGLARSLGTPADSPGEIVGTPRYMSPEQACGDDAAIGPRTDVFGLGATLYEVVTRQPPYPDGTVEDVVLRAQTGRWIDLEDATAGTALSPGLARIVRRAMAPRRRDRFESATAFREALQAWLEAGEMVEVLRVSDGQVLVREGDPADAAYRILSGRCRVTQQDGDREVLLREMVAGETFGEMAIFGDTQRTATVTATTDVQVECVPRSQVQAWLNRDGWIGPAVRTLTERFRECESDREALRRELDVQSLALALMRWHVDHPDATWADAPEAFHDDATVLEEALGYAGLRVVDGQISRR